MESLMKSRQWLITAGLLVLALAAVIGSILTRDLGPMQSPAAAGSASQQPLVDERPLLTARAMAKLASGADEHRFASQAAEQADNEVDLAFHDALRDAANHPVAATAQNRELYEHATQSEAQVKADQDQLDQLKKQLASTSGVHQERVQEQLDVAQAQLELDQNESNDAKEDLLRSGADPGSLIQRQFDQHEAVEHGTDAKPAAAASAPEINYQAGSLWAQFAAWRALRSRAIPLEKARDEARQTATTLTEKHAALDKQVTAAKAKQRENPPAAGQSGSGQPSPVQSSLVRSGSAQSNSQSSSGQSNAQPGSAPTTPSAVKALHRLSDDQKNLADFDKRIQDEQELANSYAGWIAVIQSHQRSALHGMIQSALWIVLIMLSVYLGDRSIDRYLSEVGSERTRLHTLRAVIRFSVQAVGVALILLVILGAPQQTTTFLGLATAGITVAMKDFIVAFFGWFVLMGKNGLRVGDLVEIDGVAGEVVEINLLRTILLETGNWTDTGHPTGRKVAFVNSYAIEGHFFNFTTSGQWMWDELLITVPPNQDPYPLLDTIQKTVTKETETNAAAAEKEWKNAASNYKVSSVSAAPAVNLRPTSAGVEVHVRYIARAQERSAIRAHLNQALVELLHRRGVDETESMSAAK
jgi:small-conductance mechanosensitive channel